MNIPPLVLKENAKREIKAAIAQIEKNYGASPDVVDDILSDISLDYQKKKNELMAAQIIQTMIEEEKKNDNTDAGPEPHPGKSPADGEREPIR